MTRRTNDFITSPLLDCIVTIDHEGCITEFSPAAERTFGYRRDEVIGSRLSNNLIARDPKKWHAWTRPWTNP
jgi:PAS domain S-box-containing protein